MSGGGEQREYWNTAGGDRLLRNEGLFDRFVGAFGHAALQLLALQRGEHVLDVGCGSGETLSALAHAVGTTGSVTGVDLSVPLVERARERVPVAMVVAGDAATQVFEKNFDALYSRFGVMFFAEPLRAFRHFRELLLPGGRMAFVCWGPLAANPWAEVAMQEVRAVVPQARGWTEAGPGPFSLGRREVLAAVLVESGFQSLSIEPFGHVVELSTSGLQEAARFALMAGPASRFLVGSSAADRARALQAVAERLRPYLQGERVALPAASWLVSIRK